MKKIFLTRVLEISLVVEAGQCSNETGGFEPRKLSSLNRSPYFKDLYA